MVLQQFIQQSQVPLPSWQCNDGSNGKVGGGPRGELAAGARVPPRLPCYPGPGALGPPSSWAACVNVPCGSQILWLPPTGLSSPPAPCPLPSPQPYIVFRWNSLAKQFNGAEWPLFSTITFEACASGSIAYTDAARPALSIRVSRNPSYVRGAVAVLRAAAAISLGTQQPCTRCLRGRR